MRESSVSVGEQHYQITWKVYRPKWLITEYSFRLTVYYYINEAECNRISVELYYIIFTGQMIRISHIFDRAFIKGQALGKLNACENDFACLSLINKFSLNHFALLSKKFPFC